VPRPETTRATAGGGKTKPRLRGYSESNPATKQRIDVWRFDSGGGKLEGGDNLSPALKPWLGCPAHPQLDEPRLDEPQPPTTVLIPPWSFTNHDYLP